MKRNFINGPMAPTATADLSVGGLDWVPGGIKKTGPGFPYKRRSLVTGVPSFADERGMRDNLPNGRVHITKAIDLSGSKFKSDDLGLGELLFEHSAERDLPFGTQSSRIVTYSEVNRRLANEIRIFASTKAYATCSELFLEASRFARKWKFIGTQPTDHVSMAQGRDFVHMAVAASHKCNVANVFLADNVPRAGDRLYLCIKTPHQFQVADEAKMGTPAALPYIEALQHMCLSPFVSKHRHEPDSPHYIYIGIANFMYGTQYDPRDPYRIHALAQEAISNKDRAVQLRAIKLLPTIDIFLLR